MNWEKKILEYLVDNYRKSKKDSGDNKTNRRTQVKPEKLYRKYRENDGEFDVINEMNRTVADLCMRGFLTCEREKFGTQLNCIYLADDQIEVVEDYLHKKYDFISKRMKKDEIQKIIARYYDLSEVCALECDYLHQELERNKIPKDYEELPKIFEAIAFIENNQTELFIREASMKIYGDSKYFEENTLIPTCHMLRKYRNRPCSSEELIDEILVDYGIKKEPQKLCIKGNFTLFIDGKELDFSVLPEGIELDASCIEKIDCIKLGTTKFMTIENRTSYLRYSALDEVVFYLGGFANRFQRDFIKKVYEDNPDVEYLHFGDIDAGGFWIHYNLCEIAGVEFKTFCMSVHELSMKQYEHCLHPLTDNDIVRLQELKEVELYADTVQYMLQNNVKLEQEIISFKLMKEQ